MLNVTSYFQGQKKLFFFSLTKFKSVIVSHWEDTSTLNEFIGCEDLKEYCEISPEHSRDNDKRKGVVKC